jgi:hypothetical protein
MKTTAKSIVTQARLKLFNNVFGGGSVTGDTGDGDRGCVEVFAYAR